MMIDAARFASRVTRQFVRVLVYLDEGVRDVVHILAGSQKHSAATLTFLFAGLLRVFKADILMADTAFKSVSPLLWRAYPACIDGHTRGRPECLPLSRPR